MNSIEFLLTANGLLLGFVGYFLKNLHGQFSVVIERVNELYTQHHKEASAASIHRENRSRELDEVRKRIDKLERGPTMSN